MWSPWLQAPHGAHVSVTEPMTSRTEKCWVKAGGQSDCRSDKQHRCPEAQTCESGPRRRPAPLTPAPRQSHRRRQLSEAARAPCSLPQAHVPVPSLQEEPPALCGRSRQGFCGAQGPGPGLSLVRGIWGPSWEERLSGLRLAHVAGAGGRPAKLCIWAGVAAAWPGQDCRPEPPPVSPPRAWAPRPPRGWQPGGLPGDKCGPLPGPLGSLTAWLLSAPLAEAVATAGRQRRRRGLQPRWSAGRVRPHLEAARGRRGPSRLAEVTPQARPFLFPSIHTPP